jgi:hypothetical protein
VDEPRAVFQRRIVAHDEADCLAAIEYAAAVAENAVDELHAFADLGGRLCARIDGEIFQLVRAFNVGAFADIRVLYDAIVFQHAVAAYDAVSAEPVVELRIGHPRKLRHQSFSVAEFCPEPGIAREHAVEWVNPTAAIFVHHVERDPHRFVFALHDDAVAEFCMVGNLNFRVVDENTVVVDDVVGEVGAVRYHAVVSDVAGDDLGVEDACLHRNVVVLQGDVLQT